MKTHLNSWLSIAITLISAGSLMAGAPLVRLEKAPGVTGPWQSVVLDPANLTADGGLLDLTDPVTAFYRLRIESKDAAGGVLAMPLRDAPTWAIEIATEYLQTLNEENWKNCVLASFVYPVYGPEGTTPAFLEFKVVPKSGLSAASQLPTGLGRLSAPVDPQPDRGYILVCLDRQDVPVPEYASEGPTPVEKLRQLAPTTAIHIVRYSEAFLAAESAKGELVASVGSTPYRLASNLLDYAGLSFTTEVENNEIISRPAPPKLSPTPYSSYREYKQDYLQGSVYKTLRRMKAEAASVLWNLRDGKMPQPIDIPLKDTTKILTDQVIQAFDLGSADVVKVVQFVPGQKGMELVGLQAGAVLLQVVSPAYDSQFYVVRVAYQAGSPTMTAQGWGSWHEDYAGSFNDQKRYQQEWDLSGCCNDAWSGCGPTAWAMFYGYWDSRGATRLIGGAGSTPLNNNADVQECIRAVFGYVDTWCTGINDQAATNPWDMDEGYRWAGARSEGISISTSWCVPYLSSDPRNRAKGSIRTDGRPAIVGTGYYEHYPFAYGYRYREYRFWGVTWDTDHQWKVNNGHANTSGQWVSANSCWFGARGYCW